jgi:hypothetical protein
MSGSVGASGEQSPEATRPGLLPLPLKASTNWQPSLPAAPPVRKLMEHDAPCGYTFRQAARRADARVYTSITINQLRTGVD